MIRISFCLSLLMLLGGCGIGPDMSRDRVPPAPTPTPWQGEVATTEYIRQGDQAAAANDYAGAVKHYKNAYDQDQYQQKLEKGEMFKLIGKLATAYTKTGDTRNARMVLAYGISKDYAYPLNHYYLAVTFAEEGNEAEALSHLRKAYKGKSSLPKGEKLPDPLTDAAFSSLHDSDTFKTAVSAMKRGAF